MPRPGALRVLVPLLLLAGAAVAWLLLRTPSRPAGPPEGIEPGTGTQLEGFTFTDFEGGRRRLRVKRVSESFDSSHL